MRITRNPLYCFLLLLATYSVVTIAILFRIDAVVNESLYSYGLQFSPDWAITYWTTIRTGLAVSFLAVIAAVALLLYASFRKSKTVDDLKEKGGLRMNPWCTYTLSDGSVIKVTHKLKGATRLQKSSPDGLPMYAVDCDNIVQVVSAPDKFAKKSPMVSA